ncbi:MAG TPA: aldose epimerase family protein [Pseudomonadales bacterium]|nr:aldose epimerase family protein [Pseudomonadales bacterium]
MDPQQPIELSGPALRASITPYGGYLTRLRVANGRDVVLGHSEGEGRVLDNLHLGCLIGRHANRIRAGMFELDGWHHQVPCNGTDSHLHGGLTGFGAQVWQVVDQGARSLSLHLHSPAGHENYTGNMEVTARFSIEAPATLRLELTATTDAPTLCNLTWHPYFNLAGHAGGHVGAHRISIDADQYLPLAADHCPTGEIADVTGTPFDLREPKRMNIGMVARDPQIRAAEGYDHCFLIRGEGLRRAARVVAPDERVAMEVWSTQRGLQFYTGNSLDVPKWGKQEEHYRRHEGFCLEAQGLPDASNHKAFPSNELRPGETYQQIIEYRFEV